MSLDEDGRTHIVLFKDMCVNKRQSLVIGQSRTQIPTWQQVLKRVESPEIRRPGSLTRALSKVAPLYDHQREMPSPPPKQEIQRKKIKKCGQLVNQDTVYGTSHYNTIREINNGKEFEMGIFFT